MKAAIVGDVDTINVSSECRLCVDFPFVPPTRHCQDSALPHTELQLKQCRMSPPHMLILIVNNCILLITDPGRR